MWVGSKKEIPGHSRHRERANVQIWACLHISSHSQPWHGPYQLQDTDPHVVNGAMLPLNGWKLYKMGTKWVLSQTYHPESLFILFVFSSLKLWCGRKMQQHIHRESYCETAGNPSLPAQHFFFHMFADLLLSHHGLPLMPLTINGSPCLSAFFYKRSWGNWNISPLPSQDPMPLKPHSFICIFCLCSQSKTVKEIGSVLTLALFLL